MLRVKVRKIEACEEKESSSRSKEAGLKSPNMGITCQSYVKARKHSYSTFLHFTKDEEAN